MQNNRRGRNLNPELQKLVEVTAVVHDIACPLCRVKYGNTNGKHQEEESAALLEELNANYVIGARARGIPERRISLGTCPAECHFADCYTAWFVSGASAWWCVDY